MTVRHEYYDRGGEEVICLFEIDAIHGPEQGHTKEELDILIDSLGAIRDEWVRRTEEENSLSLFEETDDE